MFYAGEPELAVAVHCLKRPIIIYKQVTAWCLVKTLLFEV